MTRWPRWRVARIDAALVARVLAEPALARLHPLAAELDRVMAAARARDAYRRRGDGR